MMRRSLVFAVALLLASASVAMAQDQKKGRPGGGQRPGGQGQGPGGFGGGGVTGLLASPEVQKELSVTADQKGLIDDMLKDLRPTGGGGGGGADFRNLSAEEREKLVAEFRKQGEERAKKADEMTKMILEPKQVERLNQLRIQSEGVSALARAEVADKLSLTQEQKDKIAKIRESSRGERGGFGNQGNASQEDRQKAFAEAKEKRDKANGEILAVLTAKQKESWEQMQGKKFDFPQQGRRPGAN